MALDSRTFTNSQDPKVYRRLRDVKQVGLVGIGTVGLCLAVQISSKFETVIAFDIDLVRVAQLAAGLDSNDDFATTDLTKSNLTFTNDASTLVGSDIIIVGVAAHIDESGNIDMTNIESATKLVAKHLKTGAIVIYESTVYPGFTQDVCVPILERESGLRSNVDFHVAYSPERINTKDDLHTISNIIKPIAAENDEVLDLLAEFYSEFIAAGVVKAASIRCAEAAKVLENAQRDVNIALMNEASIVYGRMGISMTDVLSIAKTKWNFFPAVPGLVSGSCIRSAPWHLIKCAKNVGYDPILLTASRQTNENMVPLLLNVIEEYGLKKSRSLKLLKVGVLGLSYKEESSDCRQSLSAKLVKLLQEKEVECRVFDPVVDAERCRVNDDITLADIDDLADVDVLLIAVPHVQITRQLPKILADLKHPALVIDLKATLHKADIGKQHTYWSL